MLMLYAATADADFTSEEENLIKTRFGSEVWTRISDLFSKMNDTETLELILDHKGTYCRNADEREEALGLIRTVFNADHRYSQFEHGLMQVLNLLLK